VSEPPTLSVVLADDVEIVRAGLRTILEAQPDIRVAAEARNGREAVAAAARLRPDVVLMDVRMPEMDGIEATRRIVGARMARVIVLTTFALDEYVWEALAAGASGFLSKDVSPERLCSAVRDAVAGDVLLSPDVTRRLVEHFTTQPPPGNATPQPLRGLSEREVEILRLIAEGLSNAEIARRLYVAESTIKTHVSNILTKIDARDRVQAVVIAYRTRLVS
jgi:DNA-binding NarL/FixJ family response regulator